MTSQLNVDTIVDKAGSGGTNVKIGNTSTYVSDGGAVTQNTVQGLAKVWSHHTSVSSTSLEDSFNCSSISDSGTGNSVITMTNAMSNDDYSCTASSGIPANSGYCDVSNSSTSTYTLRSFNVVTSTATITIADVADNSCTVNGDLA